MIVPLPQRYVVAALLAICAPVVLMLPAAAHGFTSAVYAEVTQPADGLVRAELELEYVLLVRSVAKAESDPELESRAKSTFQTSGADIALLEEHGDAVLDYVGDRFGVAVEDKRCAPARGGPFRATERDGVPHAVVVLDFACPASAADAAYQLTSRLFPESEGFVGSTETIVEYDLSGRAGNAVITVDDPTFATDEAFPSRLWDIFVLGAEHLLFGLDHILFLLALIVGSRRPREILMAATAFTAAHSVTFVLAALGLVSIPAEIVEPVIALSIVAVAAWHVWSALRGGRAAPDVPAESASTPGPAGGADGTTLTLMAPAQVATADARLSGQRARLAVVFGFGLIHGLGFAGALGIDEPFSWALLGSLLVFNLGIEVVQLGVIAVVFPLLMVLRRRQPVAGRLLGIVVAAGVAVVGTFWFVQRLLGLG